MLVQHTARLAISSPVNAVVELSIKGIICHIYIDAPIEAPDTWQINGRGLYQKLLEERANGKDGMVIPEKVAGAYHIAHRFQPGRRS